jgi:hypothetical protein
MRQIPKYLFFGKLNSLFKLPDAFNDSADDFVKASLMFIMVPASSLVLPSTSLIIPYLIYDSMLVLCDGFPSQIFDRVQNIIRKTCKICLDDKEINMKTHKIASDVDFQNYKLYYTDFAKENDYIFVDMTEKNWIDKYFSFLDTPPDYLIRLAESQTTEDKKNLM